MQRAAHLTRRREGAREPLLDEHARTRCISNIDQHHAAGLLQIHGVDEEHRRHAFGQEKTDGQSGQRQRRLDAGSIGALHPRADEPAVARKGEQMACHDGCHRARVEASLVEGELPRLRDARGGSYLVSIGLEARGAIARDRMRRVDPAVSLDVVAEHRHGDRALGRLLRAAARERPARRQRAGGGTNQRVWSPATGSPIAGL